MENNEVQDEEEINNENNQENENINNAPSQINLAKPTIYYYNTSFLQHLPNGKIHPKQLTFYLYSKNKL